MGRAVGGRRNALRSGGGCGIGVPTAIGGGGGVACRETELVNGCVGDGNGRRSVKNCSNRQLRNSSDGDNIF